jgi:hypothetical protein
MTIPAGCYKFDGLVCAMDPRKLPIPESRTYEVRVHSKKLYGATLYYIEKLSPTAILAKVEDNQEGGGERERRWSRSWQRSLS